MNYKVLSLFPEMFEAVKSTSILKKAIENNKIDIEVIDFRKFTKLNNKKVDDTIYGGGSGMLIAPQPIDDAVEYIKSNIPLGTTTKYVYMSPRGKKLTQEVAKKIVNDIDNLVILCGHYEGVDERVLRMHNFEELSIGDYVLTGGEIPSMVLIDSTARLVKGVINENSLINESFENDLLEHSQYTKPFEYKGMKVPEVLISGHHQNIDEYRRKESIYITYKNRPDLIEKAIDSGKISRNELEEIIKEGGNS